MTARTATRPRVTAAAPFRAGFPAIALLRMADVARQRRALAALDDDRLADLGLSRAEAAREAARPFWDLAGTCAARR